MYNIIHFSSSVQSVMAYKPAYPSSKVYSGAGAGASGDSFVHLESNHGYTSSTASHHHSSTGSVYGRNNNTTSHKSDLPHKGNDSSDIVESPLKKLTVDLIKTYRSINEV